MSQRSDLSSSAPTFKLATSMERLRTRNKAKLDKLGFFDNKGTVKTEMTRDFYKACNKVEDPNFFQKCAKFLTNIGLKTPTREEIKDENVSQSLIKIASFQSLRIQYLQYCCFGKIEIIGSNGQKEDITKEFFDGFSNDFADLLRFVPLHRWEIHDRCQSKVLSARAKEVLKVIYGGDSLLFRVELNLMFEKSKQLKYNLSSSFQNYLQENTTQFSFASVHVKELWFDSNYTQTQTNYNSAIKLAQKALKASAIHEKIAQYKASIDVLNFKELVKTHLLKPYRNRVLSQFNVQFTNFYQAA